MLSKNQIKYIQSLHQKKYRQMYGYFLVEGRKSVEDLISSYFEINTIYATNEWNGTQTSMLVEKVEIVDAASLQKIATHQHPDEVVALVKIPSIELPPVLPSGKYIVLDCMNDPGNAGTIIRTADWFGWDGVIFLENSVDIFNPKTVNAAKGSLFKIPIFQSTSAALFSAANNHVVYGAFLDGEAFDKIKKEENALLIIGNEANGISESISSFVQKKISIPKKGNAESLNAGVAAAVLMSRWP
jgi:TrmH family RNA methyltransferase